MNQLSDKSNDKAPSPSSQPKTLASFGYYNRGSSATKRSFDKNQKKKTKSAVKRNTTVHSKENIGSKPLITMNYLVKAQSPVKHQPSPQEKVNNAERLYAVKVTNKLPLSDEKVYMKSGMIQNKSKTLLLSL